MISNVVATYKIIESKTKGFEPHGAAAAFWRCRDSEMMLSGPAETGKTIVSLHKLDAIMWKYAGAQAVIVRKNRSTIMPTVLQTYIRKVLMGDAVKSYGGENPEWFNYPNGSRVWIAGIDDPGKALSSERDIIYVNQAEELNVADWETLLTRATGRAGNMPYSQVFGDCNPGNPRHWIKLREVTGSLKLFESRHEDNPTLFDPETGAITEQGRRALKILDGLTGVRFLRLRKGLWAAAEGTVYDEFDPAIHKRPMFAIPKEWRRIRVIDFGYKNPFVCLWLAQSPDGRLYRYRELYGTKRIVADWAVEINRLSEGEAIEGTVCDHDAEDRATLERAGIYSVPAIKDVSPGIQAVQKRLRKCGDGEAGLILLEGALVERDPLLDEAKKPCCTDEEVDCYVWAKGQDGKPLKEVPVKENDHGLDALRYGVAFFDGVGEQSLEFSVGTGGVVPKTAAPAVSMFSETGWN